MTKNLKVEAFPNHYTMSSDAPITSIAISDDQYLVATGDETGLLRVFDRQSRTLLNHVQLQCSPIAALTFVARDQILVFSEDGSVQSVSYELRNTRLLRRLRSAAPFLGGFSKGGRYLWAIAHREKAAILMLGAKSSQTTVLFERQGLFECGACDSRSDTWSFSCDTGAGLIVFADGGSKTFDMSLESDRASSICVRWAPTPRLIIGTDNGHLLRSLNLMKPELLATSHRGMVTTVLETDEGALVSMSYDKTIVRTSPTGEQRSFLLDRSPRCVALDENGAALGFQSGQVKYVDWRQETSNLTSDFSPGVRLIAVSPNGGQLAITRTNGEVTVLDSGTGSVLRRYSTPTPIRCVSFATDQDLVCICGEGAVELSKDGSVGRPNRILGEESIFCSVANIDGSTLAILGRNDAIALLDTRTLSVRHRLKAAFSPTGIGVCPCGGHAIVWDESRIGVSQGLSEMHEIELGVRSAISKVSFLYSCSRAIAGFSDGSVALLDIGRGVLLWKRQVHDTAIADIHCISETEVLVASIESALKVLRISTGDLTQECDAMGGRLWMVTSNMKNDIWLSTEVRGPMRGSIR